jgi:hypothetical protein
MTALPRVGCLTLMAIIAGCSSAPKQDEAVVAPEPVAVAIDGDTSAASTPFNPREPAGALDVEMNDGGGATAGSTPDTSGRLSTPVTGRSCAVTPARAAASPETTSPRRAVTGSF